MIEKVALWLPFFVVASVYYFISCKSPLYYFLKMLVLIDFRSV